MLGVPSRVHATALLLVALVDFFVLRGLGFTTLERGGRAPTPTGKEERGRLDPSDLSHASRQEGDSGSALGQCMSDAGMGILAGLL